MVRGLAVLLFQGLAASPSLCRSLLGVRAVFRSPRPQSRVLSSEKTLTHNNTEPGSVKDFSRTVVMSPYRPALSTSSLLDELPERRPMTVILVSGAWRQFCYATA